MLTLPARIDTFESHELSWVPDDLKVLFREILSWTQDIGGVYAAALPIVRRWFQATGAEGILDLCSGAGGPGVTLLNAMRADNLKVKMKLTDLYPANEVYANLKLQYPGILQFESASTDATNSRRDADYPVRSLLSAFHHFSPNLARKILVDAAKNSDGIASVLRGYTPDELLSLADVPECRSFVWQAGTWNYLPGTGLSGVYLIGRRK